MPALWTIGHSTRSLEEFLHLLHAEGIRLLADVRAFPYSRRHPQFNTDVLPRSLQDAGIDYRHVPKLGGRRKGAPGSLNVGWRNAGFRGYADYMQTPQFAQGLEELIEIAQRQPIAIMCAEAVPWRCHRSLVADAMVARGWSVLDIVGAGKIQRHVLPSWARVQDGRVSYPGPVTHDAGSRLF